MPRREHLITAGAILLFASSAHAFTFEFARATSEVGQFSVVLPKPFAELPPNFGVRRTAPIHPKKSFVIGGKPAPGVIFIATKMVYENASDARSIVRSVSAFEPPGFRQAYAKKVEAAGLSGLEIKSISRSTVGYRRLLVAGDTVFILSVEAPAAKDGEIGAAARKFLDSLTLAKAKKT